MSTVQVSAKWIGESRFRRRRRPGLSAHRLESSKPGRQEVSGRLGRVGDVSEKTVNPASCQTFRPVGR